LYDVKARVTEILRYTHRIDAILNTDGGLAMSDTPVEPSIGRVVQFRYIKRDWKRETGRDILREVREVVVVPAFVTRPPYQRAGLWVIDLYAISPDVNSGHVYAQGVPEGEGAGCWSKIPPAEGW